MLTDRQFTGARFYLVTSSASVFGILNYHFRYSGECDNAWISLFFQALVVGINTFDYSFARMTNFDLLHGLALGYYIAAILFSRNKVGLFYYSTLVGLLILNAYFFTGYSPISGELNLPIILICFYKYGDLVNDILQLLVLYRIDDHIVMFGSIFQILTFIYTRFYLVLLIFPSKFSKLYNLLVLLSSAMSAFWGIGHIVTFCMRISK